MPANPRMYVTIAPPPDGWEGSVPDLFNLLANNIEVAVPDGFLVGTQGSATPPDDSGPWLKDGLEWYVWDPVLGVYRAIDQTSTVGEITYFGQTNPLPDPSHWIRANGIAISRTTYAALYAVYGTTFGAGDGSSSFALPTIPDIVDTGANAVHCHAWVRYA